MFLSFCINFHLAAENVCNVYVMIIIGKVNKTKNELNLKFTIGLAEESTSIIVIYDTLLK